MLTKDAFKSRRFRIWSICLLIVIIGSAFFLLYKASRPSEPWVSVNFIVTTNYVEESNIDSDEVSNNVSIVTIQVSNRMSFNVECLILADVLRRGPEPYGTVLVGGQLYSIGARSQRSEVLRLRYWTGNEPARWRIQYGRQLYSVERALLNKIPWPWLKSHYPFYRWHTSALNEPKLDFQVSGK